MNRLKEHFTQDASVAGALLAFGFSSLAIVVALTAKIDWGDDLTIVPVIVVGIVTFVPGPVVFAMRFRSPKPAARKGFAARCELCGASPATEVRYLQVVGIVVVAVIREAKIRACRTCSSATCKKMSLTTVAFGWWMLLTPLVVPWVLLNNLLFFLRARSRLSSPAGLVSAFDEHADYARNLLRTKDRATVVEVMRDQLRTSDDAVEAWLRTLE